MLYGVYIFYICTEIGISVPACRHTYMPLPVLFREGQYTCNNEWVIVVVIGYWLLSTAFIKHIFFIKCIVS